MARRSSVSSGASAMAQISVRPRSRSAELWRGPVRHRGWPTQRLSLSGSPAPTPRALPGAGVFSSGIGRRTCPVRCCSGSWAYRIQADAAGDLDPATIKLLDRLGRGEIAEIPLPELRAVKPGTLLVREWDGTLQRVVVLESGFAWNAGTYESLSKVARAITGTNWNGPRFFGLRHRARAS